MHTFGLQVMSINGIFYDGRAKNIILPAIDGQVCIEAYHEGMWVAIYSGEIKIQKPDGEWIVGVCGNGSVQVINNRCIVLCDTVEKPGEIDVRRAKEALEIAEEKVRAKKSIEEYKMGQAAMARAISRLRAAGGKIGGLD